MLHSVLLVEAVVLSSRGSDDSEVQDGWSSTTNRSWQRHRPGSRTALLPVVKKLLSLNDNPASLLF